MLQADHEAAALVIVAVVVLIDGPVAPVGVPGLSVAVPAAVVVGIIHLIVLEHRVFTLPGPHAGRHTAKGLVSSGPLALVVLGIDLAGRAVCHVILYNGPVAVHGGDGIAAYILQVVVPNEYVCHAISLGSFIGNGRIGEFRMVRRIRQGDAPAVDALQVTILNADVVVPGNAGGAFIFGLKDGKVDTAVVHVLVLYVALHILDVQALQIDVVQRAAVLGYHRHTGTVHHTAGIVLHIDIQVAVGHGDVADFDVLAVVQQNGRGHIAAIDMLGIVQRCAVVLIPDALSVGVDHGQSLPAVTVCVDHDGRILSALDLAQVQKLIVENRTPLQIHFISSLECDVLFFQHIQ